ncbi:glutaredoxin-C4-like [Tasmannia lanceolata]|uniref:glutaredoxin-C4-like n=1 Tax=Tasmannia lanceolata TaxID=3420 RepID=UPI004063AE60
MPSLVSTLSKNLVFLSVANESRAFRSFPHPQPSNSCKILVSPIKSTQGQNSIIAQTSNDEYDPLSNQKGKSIAPNFPSSFFSSKALIIEKKKRLDSLFGRVVKIWKDFSAMGNLNGAMILAFFFLVSLFTASNASGSTPEEAFVKKIVSQHDIVMFSKSYCPYCRRAKAVFKELNKVPHVIELDQRDDGADIQDALSTIIGRRTVPQVFINGKHIGGSDDTVDAYENGTLGKLLGITSEDEL